MSFIGVQRLFNNNLIVVKLHGPTDKFEIDPNTLHGTLFEILADTVGLSIDKLPDTIAEIICSTYVDDKDILWVEVVVTKLPDGIIYGAVADKVTEDVSC